MYSTSLLSGLTALATLSGVLAHPAHFDWYHAADSPVAKLFEKRAPSPNDPNFASNYPAGWQTPDASTLPKAWTDKLASISLPDIQPSAPNNGYPQYAGGESGADEHICSFTYECSTSDDLVQPPDGVLALSFDDGPTSSSPTLYAFLAQNNVADKTTHFMIGGNILGSPTTMQAAAQGGGHIAVHTWSHPYSKSNLQLLTTLSNAAVLGELGWTMQIIADLNGGRIPKYWRPPFGDVDNRVRAIAKGVFGLETVPWDKDSGDWAISTGTYTRQQVDDTMNGWLTGPKSPGLNILEHELNDNTINVFMDNYGKMVSNGWNISNVADAWSMAWYQNSGDSNTGAVASMAVADTAAGAAAVSASGASSNSSSTSSGSQSMSMSMSSAQSAGSTSKSASPTTTSRSSSISSGAAAAAASVTKTGSAGLNAQPGVLLALLGVIGAALL